MATALAKPTSAAPTEPLEVELDDDVQMGVYVITPEVAAYWLDQNNTDNVRRIQPRIVEEYARDIINDAWPLNFQPITFRRNGSLDNGQHRLAAVIKAQKPITCLVVWGVDDTVYDTVDIGLRRTAGQIIAVENPRYANFMAAAATLLWRLDQPNPQRLLLDVSIRPTIHDRMMILDKYNIIDEDHPNGRLFASVEYLPSRCGNVWRSSGSSSVAIVFHFRGTQTRGRRAADRFFHLLNTGLAAEGEPALTATHPAYRLREKLQKIKRNQIKVRQPFVYGLWLNAWNAYATGEPMRSLHPLDYTTNPDLTIL